MNVQVQIVQKLLLWRLLMPSIANALCARRLSRWELFLFVFGVCAAVSVNIYFAVSNWQRLNEAKANPVSQLSVKSFSHMPQFAFVFNDQDVSYFGLQRVVHGQSVSRVRGRAFHTQLNGHGFLRFLLARFHVQHADVCCACELFSGHDECFRPRFAARFQAEPYSCL